VAQDDYYYEIQLTNKQLVFYFMAGATGLILSFLAGVMVGRGVDASSDVQAARPVVEDRVVTEEPAARPLPAAEDLSYSQRLESDRVDDSLEKPADAGGRQAAAPAPAAAKPTQTVASSAPEPAAAKPAPAKSAAPKPAPAKSAPAAKPVALPKVGGPAPGTFSIQVGAFKDRGSADSMVARLKGKGYAAFAVSPVGADALFNVRVGSFEARADAERIQDRLRDEEKFKPFIVRN
jgi:cell division septation protein DedD